MFLTIMLTMLLRLSHPKTEQQTVSESPTASEPPPELPSSASVLQDLEDFLKSLRKENGDPASDT